MVNLRESSVMDELEARSNVRGQRVTTLRRQVLALLLKRGGHASAYELIDDLPSVGRRPSPPPVYRALEFLIEVGLVKRLSSTNTFVVPPLNAPESGHTVFLVCEKCGAVEAVASLRLQSALVEAAEDLHYRIEGCHTEVKGVCWSCQQRAHALRLGTSE